MSGGGEAGEETKNFVEPQTLDIYTLTPDGAFSIYTSHTIHYLYIEYHQMLKTFETSLGPALLVNISVPHGQGHCLDSSVR